MSKNISVSNVNFSKLGEDRKFIWTIKNIILHKEFTWNIETFGNFNKEVIWLVQSCCFVVSCIFMNVISLVFRGFFFLHQQSFVVSCCFINSFCSVLFIKSFVVCCFIKSLSCGVFKKSCWKNIFPLWLPGSKWHKRLFLSTSNKAQTPWWEDKSICWSRHD